jgi:hypothetical protein
MAVSVSHEDLPDYQPLWGKLVLYVWFLIIDIEA